MLGVILGGFSGGKGRLILTAGLVVLGGLAWNTGNLVTKPGSPGSGSSLGESLRPNWTEGSARKEGFLKKGNEWGDAAIQIGLSFMAAMIFGSLLRVAFKTAISLLVVAGVVLWLLQSQGIIDPITDDYYSSVKEGQNWMMNKISIVGKFLQEQFPSASAALIGFGFGLRK